MVLSVCMCEYVPPMPLCAPFVFTGFLFYRIRLHWQRTSTEPWMIFTVVGQPKVLIV